MRDDGLLRVPREPVHEPPGDDDRRVVHREPGRGDVRRLRVDQQHARRRHRGGHRHLLHQVGQPLLGQVAGPGRPRLHPPEHPADARAPERQAHHGPEQHDRDQPGKHEQSDEPVPRHVHVRPPHRRPHRRQQIEHAVEPPGDRLGNVEHEIGEVDRYGRRRHQDRRDEDGERDAGDGEHHHDQGRGYGAGPAVAPLLLEEVDRVAERSPRGFLARHG